MMNNNGGGFYPSPYTSTPLNGIRSNFNVVTPPAVPSYYNLPFQQGQQAYQNSQQRLINQQNHENTPKLLLFKFYDLDKNNDNEIVRLIFSFVGVTYKNKRYQQDEWNKVKEQMQFENLPILRTNNQFKIFQINTIIRYLAREFHLNGMGQGDHVIIDMVHETVREFREKIFDQNKDDSTDFEQKLRQIIADHSPTYLKQLEKYYEIFNRPGPFYLGSHPSLADLLVYDTINYLIKVDKKILDNYSRLKDTRRRLEKHPRLINYLNAKNNNNENKSQDQTVTLPQRNRTKSPIQNGTSHQHRHQSHEQQEALNRRHHHHHHHHHHHGHHSKEPTPVTPKKHQEVRQSNSPSISKKEKESTSLRQSKQRSIRSSNSPNNSIKDKELTTLSQAKKRSVRSSKSPNNLTKDKDSKSPNNLTKDKDSTPPSQTKQRSSNSPVSSTKDKDSTPPSQTKQKSVRSSKSPSTSNTEKEATPLRTTDVPPPPPVPVPTTATVPMPPATTENKSRSKQN
ncbi:unnamed protein product [Rotaria socialis]|uniref:Glutathione S-transferase n=1 Tax=Rotaria socialis TaxID=392032 RepID=A0A820B5F4_9BILA|nr:unnamed protein product [Rotaria socialis]CAF3353044.1 unnamed protein product [Rotaria socialis]CAF4200714.1 unnamed protein product [Rotaria socialis]CAF4459717.1 unnamed protein product [Rotaria socialis]